MRTNIIVLALALSIATAAAACRGGQSNAPTSAQPSATSSTTPALAEPPFTLSGSLDSVAALDERNLNGSAWYILDLTSGLIQVLAPDLSQERIDAQGGQAGVFPSWLDDDALLVRNVDGATFVAKLSGAISPLTSPVASPTASSPTGGGVSPDGRWQASVTAVDGPGVVIGSTDSGGVAGQPSFKVTMATLPLWSPTAPATLALLVNACTGPSTIAGFDISLFDPVNGELHGLSVKTDQLIPAFVWRPDGSSIAADVVTMTDSQRRELQLIKVTTGAAQTLVTLPATVSIARGGELVPLEWNRDGSKLLFTYHPGRDICGVNVVPGPPSELQRIGG